MNMVYCGVCGVEYNALRTTHTCQPADLEMLFREEQHYGDAATLNADDLARIRQEIISNGSPANLIAMWEKSAGRKWQG